MLLGKDLKWGHFGNSGPALSSCLAPGPHSQNSSILGPYPDIIGLSKNECVTIHAKMDTI
jgi:hypothetical protein